MLYVVSFVCSLEKTQNIYSVCTEMMVPIAQHSRKKYYSGVVIFLDKMNETSVIQMHGYTVPFILMRI